MDLTDLYRDIIIDHNRAPHNYGSMRSATRHADGYNPLCGDRLTVYLKMDGDRVEKVSFEGSGCAISVASASLMTDHLKGKTKAQAQAAFGQIHALLTGATDDAPADLGKLAALAGVRDYPSRVKCATLCWHTIQAALNEQDAVTTE